MNLDQIYPELRDAWISGDPALPQAPEEWRPVVDGVEPAEAERRLIALAGQALEVGFRPAPPDDVSARPDLPNLAKPRMPDFCRGLFRTVLAQETVVSLLKLVDARGFSAHPLDWFPAASTENLPETYLPWQDWLRGLPTDSPVPINLDDENWAYAAPSARLTLLRAMRADEPDRARQLIADHASAEAAEARYALVNVLGVNLTMADEPYLTSLAGDRSPKVKTLAAGLLSRLGVGSGSSDDLRELGAFFDVTIKGLLNRMSVITPTSLKTQAQVSRRRELLERFTLTDLAGVLLLSNNQLIDGWAVDSDRRATSSFAAMVAKSGTDTDVDRLCQRLLPGNIFIAPQLQQRCSRPVKQALARTILASDKSIQYQHKSIQYQLLELDPDLAEAADLLDSAALKAVVKSLGAGQHVSLMPFAYVATAPAATTLLYQLTSSGVRPRDPVLAPLRLNVELAQAKETP